MASKLESFIPELLEVITGDLDSSDLARLLTCSKSFQQRLEPILYGSKDLSNRAMHWACLNGNLSTIHRAIAYGAFINAIETPHVMKGNPKPVKVLPLYLAARRSHADAFKLLLELGARVDDSDVDIRQLNDLMKCLCTSANFPLLAAFLKAGLDSQVRTRQCSEVAWPLIPAIRSGASLDIVRLLLDKGANPNQLQFCQGIITMSPLSSAIMANSVPLFNLLLESGAKIDGTDFRAVTRRALHIPIFAAAQAMARHAHGRQMMQLCLDNGANINRRATSMFNSNKYISRDTTPVLIYLDSIEK